MEQTGLIGAYLAGIVSFLAPCVLPLVPSYFSVITGFTFQELYGLEYQHIRLRVLGSSLFFVIGFSLIYTFLGATGSFIGLFLKEQLQLLLKVSGILMIALGLMQLGIIHIGLMKFDYVWNVQKRLTKIGFVTAFITGMVAALCWIPCITATLTPVLLLASAKATVLEGMALLFVFSLGLGTPFIITSLFFPKAVDNFKQHRNALHTLSLLAGAIMIAFGVLLLSNYYQNYIDFIRDTVSSLGI